LLNARGTQTSKAMRLERTLPREELLLRELIAAQGVLHCDLAAAYGDHHRGFAAGDPSRGIGGWQIVHWHCSQGRSLDSARQAVLRGSWTRPKRLVAHGDFLLAKLAACRRLILNAAIAASWLLLYKIRFPTANVRYNNYFLGRFKFMT
jgi:hypothetical protein